MTEPNFIFVNLFIIRDEERVTVSLEKWRKNRVKDTQTELLA